MHALSTYSSTNILNPIDGYAMSDTENHAIAFGPVPSRRLGHSLGINNIPPKSCSYSCLYCQVGETRYPEIHRREYFSPQSILRAVQRRLDALQAAGQQVDYLTFVPDGEPTLDIHLGRTIELLKSTGKPIAVISNASLLWQASVRETLLAAEFVSVKVDSVDESTWRRLNRPHPDLKLDEILLGIESFARHYQGTLATETMLVNEVNDGESAVGEVAKFVSGLLPATAYLSVPTRPPADPSVRPPDTSIVTRAYEQFRTQGLDAELLTVELTEEFGVTGDLENDLLYTAAVHPLSRDAIAKMLARSGKDWSLVARLVDQGRLNEVEYQGRSFFIRSWSADRGQDY
jgi:wyosine [tRNA(Phe)-imidazoG37] synthetase (radical SAM superfamily)